MKLKLLAVLAVAGICAGSLAIADSNGSRIMLADDTSSSVQQPAVGGSDNSQSGATDNSGSSSDNAGSAQDNSMPSSGDDTSGTDTGTGDDDY